MDTLDTLQRIAPKSTSDSVLSVPPGESRGAEQETAHTEDSGHTCAHCGKVVRTENGLQKHLRTIHDMEEPITGRAFKCEKCTWTFDQRTDLLRHVKRAHEKPVPTCDFPDCKFTGRGDNLTLHKKRHERTHNGYKLPAHDPERSSSDEEESLGPQSSHEQEPTPASLPSASVPPRHRFSLRSGRESQYACIERII
jgi:uncharacterized C2H2 Zn-finger protein